MSQLAGRLGVTNVIESDGWVVLGWEQLCRIEVDQVVLINSVEIDEDSNLHSMLNGNMECRIDSLVHPDIYVPATEMADIALELRTILSLARISP